MIEVKSFAGHTAVLAGILGCFLLLRGVEAAEPDASTEEVTVIGSADDALPGKADAARADAYKKALLRVAPVLVDARAASSLNQLVSSYTYTEVQGFIESAEPRGSPFSRDGIYYQPYLIRVNKGGLNLDFVKRRVDVRMLYDQVARPRICVAVQDESRGSEEVPWVADPIHFSNGHIINYFKSKHPDFVFKDARSQPAAPEELLRQAASGSFDILVQGTTRSTRLEAGSRAGKRNGWRLGSIVRAGDFQTEPASDYEYEIVWSVVDVANREAIFYVGPTNMLSADILPRKGKYAGAQAAAEDLFRELLSYWNRTALNQRMEIVFEGAAPADLPRYAEQLRAVSGLTAGSIRFESQDAGELVFSAEHAGRATEITAALARAFEDFEVIEAQPRRIRLSAIPEQVLSLTVLGADFQKIIALEDALRGSAIIRELTRQGFNNGSATLLLTTSKSSEDMAIFVQTKLGSEWRVTGVTPTSLDLVPR